MKSSRESRRLTPSLSAVATSFCQSQSTLGKWWVYPGTSVREVQGIDNARLTCITGPERVRALTQWQERDAMPGCWDAEAAESLDRRSYPSGCRHASYRAVHLLPLQRSDLS